MKRRLPHILVFNPDQWRGDVLGHMGNPAAVTPNLDRFASEDGVSFRNAFVQNPVCTPSRCSFMTGWHTKAAMCRTRTHKYVRRLNEPDELYDLAADPLELCNVAGDPAYAVPLAALKDRMLRWYQETCDVVPRETDKR
jgi:arylsulfatase A-like enzyme